MDPGDSVTVTIAEPSLAAYLRHHRTNGADGVISRMEVALRAGISLGYLIKLEQGAATNPSPRVIQRLAASLRLDDVQRQHLHDLVVFHRAAPDPADGVVADGHITPDMRQYVDRLGPHLAGYVDDAWNVIYAGAEYNRIFRNITHVGNVLKWLFLEPQSRSIMIEWEDEARLTVAWLRSLMVRRPGSRIFTDLLRDLTASDEFHRMWDRQETLLSRPQRDMLVHDADHNRDLRLLTQVYHWPDPGTALRLYLGVRTDLSR